MTAIAYKDVMAENRILLEQLANELRKKFFDWYDINSNEYDEEDVRQLRENDFYCQRFVSHCVGLHESAQKGYEMAKEALKGRQIFQEIGEKHEIEEFDPEEVSEMREKCEKYFHESMGLTEIVDRAFNMVKSVFKWRKEIGANQMQESDFPEEILKTEEFYPYRKDKEGNVTIMIKVGKHRKNPKTKELLTRYGIFLVEKIERKYNRRMHLTVIADCKGAGLSNVEFDLALLGRTIGMKRYPLLVSYVIVINMPWLYTAGWNIVKSWLPKQAVERVFFVDENTIHNHIDKEDLPEDLGGLDTTVYPINDPVSHLPESLLTDLQAMTVAVQ